jgi:hypothetical protein
MRSFVDLVVEREEIERCDTGLTLHQEGYCYFYPDVLPIGLKCTSCPCVTGTLDLVAALHPLRPSIV